MTDPDSLGPYSVSHLKATHLIYSLRPIRTYLQQITFTLELTEANQHGSSLSPRPLEMAETWPNSLKREASPKNFVMCTHILSCNFKTTISTLYGGLFGASLSLYQHSLHARKQNIGILRTTLEYLTAVFSMGNCRVLP